MPLIDLANPTRFLKFANRTIPWLSGLTILVFAFGINQAMSAPDDYQQGATVRIMFLHVPSAWLSMLGWGVMTVASLGTLVWRHPLADVELLLRKGENLFALLDFPTSSVAGKRRRRRRTSRG